MKRAFTTLAVAALLFAGAGLAGCASKKCCADGMGACCQKAECAGCKAAGGMCADCTAKGAK
jgi:hypothetical protein